MEEDPEAIVSMAAGLPALVTLPLHVTAVGNVRVDRFEGVVFLVVENVLPLALEAVFTQINLTSGGQSKTEEANTSVRIGLYLVFSIRPWELN